MTSKNSDVHGTLLTRQGFAKQWYSQLHCKAEGAPMVHENAPASVCREGYITARGGVTWVRSCRGYPKELQVMVNTTKVFLSKKVFET